MCLCVCVRVVWCGVVWCVIDGMGSASGARTCRCGGSRSVVHEGAWPLPNALSHTQRNAARRMNTPILELWQQKKYMPPGTYEARPYGMGKSQQNHFRLFHERRIL